jgi:hypothetical protein
MSSGGGKNPPQSGTSMKYKYRDLFRVRIVVLLSIAVLPIVLTPIGKVSAIGQNPVYEPAAKPQSAKVTILALSASLHSVYTATQEVYLADVEFKGRSHQLAKLVDTYPSAEQPIRRAILTEHHPLRMQLFRNEDCDATGQSFFLGDNDANLFDANSRNLLKNDAGATIPCYNVMHNATRLEQMSVPTPPTGEGSKGR